MAGAGSAKMVYEILGFNEILITKGLKAFFEASGTPVRCRDDHLLFEFPGQGWLSQKEPVEKRLIETQSDLHRVLGFAAALDGK
ncbi:MAG: hypothetical protein WA741_06050 [Candidatus Sulfotelmatobacter sp.]